MKGFVHVIIVIFPNHREISIFPYPQGNITIMKIVQGVQ